MKGMSHQDLIHRVNNTNPEEQKSLGEEPKLWRDFDIRYGQDRRFEIKIPVGKAISIFRKLFKGEE